MMTIEKAKKLHPNVRVSHLQNGFVLVIGMIFLLVLTVIGVSLMTGSTQDEKISGNSKRSSDAFMAAEAGSKSAVERLCTEFTDPDGNGGDRYLCDPGNESTEDSPAINPPEWFYYKCQLVKPVVDPANPVYELIEPDGSVVNSDQTIFIAETGFADGGTFLVRYGGDCTSKNDEEVGAVETMSLVSEGRQSNSMRNIHFNVGHGSGGEASWPAVFVNDNPDNPDCSFDFGPSNSYLYDGRGGPAISANTQHCVDQIRAADDGEGQLRGGVIVNNPAPDFTSPAGLERFFAALDTQTDSSRKVYGVPDNNPNKDMVVNKQALPADLGTPGDPDSMKTTIVNGHLNITGGLSGAGILIVTGTADFGGTPHWDGIILVLGGQVDIGGGGAANGLDGTLIVSNIDFSGSDSDGDGFPGPWNDDQNDEWDYTNDDSWVARWGYDADNPTINWDVSGGGNALYNYGCQNLIDAADSLSGVVPEKINFPAPESCPDSNGEGEGEGNNGSFGYLHVFDWMEEVAD